MIIKILMIAFCLFFSAIGLSCLLCSGWLYILRPKNCSKNISVIFLNEQNNENEVFYYLEKYRWYGNELFNKVIFVCETPLSDNAERILSEHKDCLYIKFEDLNDTLMCIKG